MLKVINAEADIEGGLADILTEYTVLTMALIDAIGQYAGTAAAEALVSKAFIMGHQNEQETASTRKEAPRA